MCGEREEREGGSCEADRPASLTRPRSQTSISVTHSLFSLYFPLTHSTSPQEQASHASLLTLSLARATHKAQKVSPPACACASTEADTNAHPRSLAGHAQRATGATKMAAAAKSRAHPLRVSDVPRVAQPRAPSPPLLVPPPLLSLRPPRRPSCPPHKQPRAKRCAPRWQR